MENAEQKNNTFEQYADIAPESSRASGVIFFLLCAVLVFSVIAYGAVDVWALGALSLISGIIAVLWLGEAFFKKEFYYQSSLLIVPLLGLIGIGLVQLLPLRAAMLPPDLLERAAGRFAFAQSVRDAAFHRSINRLFRFFRRRADVRQQSKTFEKHRSADDNFRRGDGFFRHFAAARQPGSRLFTDCARRRTPFRSLRSSTSIISRRL
jgi:hypothetical protein